MPAPGSGQMNVAAALQSLQKQIDQLARRPAPIAGGGAVLGYAEVSYTFPSDIPADDLNVAATAVSLNTTVGDPAMAASGDTITYAVGGAVGIYVVVAHLKVSPSRDAVPHSLNNTDGVMTFTLLEPILDTADFTSVGGLAYLNYGNLVGQLRLDYEYAYTPLCRWRNTIDSTGVLDVQECTLFITRFASP